MSSRCCGLCSKYVIFAFNVLFFIIGVALVVMALLVLLYPSLKPVQDLNDGMGSSVRWTCYLLLIIGVLAAVIGSCGCCGAFQESPCLLCLYFVFLAFLLAMQIGLGLVLSFNMASVERSFGVEFFNLMKRYPTEVQSDSTDANSVKTLVDHIQHKMLGCCGDNSSEDWSLTDWYSVQISLPIREVPPSCCENVNLDNLRESDYLACARATEEAKLLRFYRSCRQKFKDIVNSYLPLLMIVLLVLVIIELTGMILSCCLCFNSTRKFASVDRDYI